jgi:hypothetical protein
MLLKIIISRKMSLILPKLLDGRPVSAVRRSILGLCPHRFLAQGGLRILIRISSAMLPITPERRDGHQVVALELPQAFSNHLFLITYPIIPALLY